MKISIRKSKHQKEDLNYHQFCFASECVKRYLKSENSTYYSYEGQNQGYKMWCDIYKTKTQISSIVGYCGK